MLDISLFLVYFCLIACLQSATSLGILVIGTPFYLFWNIIFPDDIRLLLIIMLGIIIGYILNKLISYTQFKIS